MSTDPLKIQMAAILGTLAEEPRGGPASSFYLAIGMDLARWNILDNIGRGAGLWTTKNHWVKPTAKGIDLGKQVNAAMKKD